MIEMVNFMLCFFWSQLKIYFLKFKDSREPWGVLSREEPHLRFFKYD